MHCGLWSGLDYASGAWLMCTQLIERAGWGRMLRPTERSAGRVSGELAPPGGRVVARCGAFHPTPWDEGNVLPSKAISIEMSGRACQHGHTCMDGSTSLGNERVGDLVLEAFRHFPSGDD